MTDPAALARRALTIQERHRECNKLVARKVRARKRLELEALQATFVQVRRANVSARSVLKSVASREISSRILMDCNFQLPDNVVVMVSYFVY
jgi:hypothetical protein